MPENRLRIEEKIYAEKRNQRLEISDKTADFRIEALTGCGPLTGFNFVLGPDASGAEMELFGLSFHHYRRGMNVGFEATIGMPLRMADVLAERRCLSTDITFQGIFSSGFNNRDFTNFRAII